MDNASLVPLIIHDAPGVTRIGVARDASALRAARHNQVGIRRASESRELAHTVRRAPSIQLPVLDGMRDGAPEWQ